VYRHVLKIRQRIHPLHVGKEKLHVPYLAELLIVSITQDPIFLSDGVTREEAKFS